MMTSGAAFTPRSCQRFGSMSGETKISQTAAKPWSPIRVKRMAPVSMVRPTAMTGVR